MAKAKKNDPIRAWAKSVGIHLSKRGKIPAEIVTRYELSQKRQTAEPQKLLLRQKKWVANYRCQFCIQGNCKFCPRFMRNATGLTPDRTLHCTCKSAEHGTPENVPGTNSGKDVDSTSETEYCGTQNEPHNDHKEEKMATLRTVVSSSDLTGKEGETVERRLVSPETGETVTLDLLEAEAAKLDKFLAPYLEKAQPVRKASKAVDSRSGEIRTWAQKNPGLLPEGVKVPGSRGRLDARVVTAYEAHN